MSPLERKAVRWWRLQHPQEKVDVREVHQDGCCWIGLVRPKDATNSRWRGDWNSRIVESLDAVVDQFAETAEYRELFLDVPRQA